MIVLPARIPFPTKILQFSQSPQVTIWYEAKVRLRNEAKKTEEYHTPVEINPRVSGISDAGIRIPINSLGRWVFGVPGYRGHIDVLPFPEYIIVRLYSDIDIVMKMITKAALSLDLCLREN